MTLPTLPAPRTGLSGLLEGLTMGTQQIMPAISEMIMAKQQADIKQRQIDQILRMGEDQGGGLPDNLAMQPSGGPELSTPGSQAPQGLNLTPKKVFALSQVDPTLGNMAANLYATQEKDRLKREEREFLPKKEYIEHAAKENIDFLNQVKQLEKDAPSTKFAMAMIEDSLGDANKWAASKDWLAEHTGFAGFRSAAGTELDSAVKNYFLGDLASIKGGRANVFLEKQIRDAYMRAGQDPISNQKIHLGMKLKEQINDLKIRKTRELENKFIEKQGYLPSGFESMVNKEISKEATEIENKAIDTLHKMSKIQTERDKIFRKYLESGEVLMMDQEGNPFAVKKKEVPMYREQGYIPMGEK